jgi:uncharacterized protein
MSSLSNPLVTILFIFLGIFVYTTLAGPIPFSVNSVTTTKDSLFRVDGTGKATAVPNTAQVSLGVTKTANTVESAQQQVNTVANKIIEELKKLGVEEKNITTTNYSVNPNYDFSGGRQTITGYTVTQDVQAKISPIEKANSAIDIATRNGANMVGGVQFILGDETKKDLVKKAREMAVKEAKEKAEDLAGIAGIKLGKVVDVQESSNQPGTIMPFSVEAKDARGSANEPTQLTPGESTVTVTISLSYDTY